MDQQQQPRWRPTRRQLLWTCAIGGVLTVVVLIGYRYDITLWDWIKLLVVPAVLAGGGLWFNAQQREREQRIANERAQDEALQAYLNGMSELLTDKDRPLHRARPGGSMSSVARARTLTVLPRIDGDRKARVVQFLYEAGLIARGRPVLDLSGANLEGSNLRGADLERVDLSRVNLSRANLSRANLGADLERISTEADTMTMDFWLDTYLEHANLGTNLSRSNLSYADLSVADLSGANLSYANLEGANFRAILVAANLSRAYLTETDLSGAFLSYADLSNADLSGAKVTDEQLDQAKSLDYATMPNGKKYEEWLNDRESRGVDGKNSGPP